MTAHFLSARFPLSVPHGTAWMHLEFQSAG
jgi:hypothetical protein